MSDELPGMWEEADFMGGATDCDEPSLADRLEVGHLKGKHSGKCRTCKVPWPCDSVTAAEALREAEAENRQLRELLPANLLLWLTIGGNDE